MKKILIDEIIAAFGKAKQFSAEDKLRFAQAIDNDVPYFMQVWQEDRTQKINLAKLRKATKDAQNSINFIQQYTASTGTGDLLHLLACERTSTDLKFNFDDVSKYLAEMEFNLTNHKERSGRKTWASLIIATRMAQKYFEIFGKLPGTTHSIQNENSKSGDKARYTIFGRICKALYDCHEIKVTDRVMEKARGHLEKHVPYSKQK